MGTLSLVFGIILILIGIYFVYVTLTAPVVPEDNSSNIGISLLIEALFIAGGAYLIRKYDDDREKEVKKN